jgi:hypothetical protein
MPQGSRRRLVGAIVGAALASAALGLGVPGGPPVAAAVESGVCPGGPAPANRFADDNTSVHEAAIACTTWWELTRGVSATAFAPSRGVTRGQAATLVARLLTRTGIDLPASPPDQFPDDTGNAHSYAINRLAALGAVSGRTDGRFAPDAGLSRGAMATLVVAAYRERTGAEPPSGTDRFTDDDGTVHEHAINQAAELGLTVGSAPGEFDPWARVTRGQAASFFARLLGTLDELSLTGRSPVVLRAASALEPVGDCDPLLGTLKERALESVGPYGLGGFGIPLGIDDSFGSAPGEPAAVEGGGGDSAAPLPTTGGAETSGTNNQEIGVDEADLVKVQGSLVVAVNGGVLRVIDTTGGTPVLRGTLALGDGDHRLLLDGTRLLVMTTTQSGGDVRPLDGPTASSTVPYDPEPPVTRLLLVSLANPAAPVGVDSVSIDGYVLAARLVGGVARVVVRTEPTLDYVTPSGGSAEDVAAATARNRQIVEASTLGDWLPQVHTDGSGTGTPLLDCADVSMPPEYAGLGFSSVLTVGLAGPLADHHAVGVLAGSDLVYSSPSTLYLTSTRWESWRPPEQAADPTRTDIHAFDITAPTSATFLGSGRIAGRLLNQFSLSEHEGVLRVASTTDPPWWVESPPPGESRVTTLRLTSGALAQVGLVTGLGVDEQIFGVRFLGDLGYVVTLRQVDPLHVIDLSDPAHPAVLGELEIPGYSAYLHPVAEGLLVG